MNATRISPDWQTLQGSTLNGGYELKDILEAAEDRAVLRVRVLGDYTLKATAIFYALDDVSAEEQVSIWQSIRFFESKNAVAVPLGSGKLRLNNATVVYVVLQTADETLADAVQTQPLTPEQAIDATRAVARGLSELHANGYVHGDLAPGEVRAVGDRVEITTECIRRVNSEPVIEHTPAKYRAPESEAHNATIASDVWCLGATIFEALTQTNYEPEQFEKAADLRHPFGSLLAGCLEPDPDKRLKLSDFEAILRAKTPPLRPKPVAVVTEPPKVAAAGANGAGNIVPAAEEPAAKAEVSSAQTEALAAKPDSEPKSTPAPFIVRDEPAAKTPENAERRQPTAVIPYRPTSRQTIREQARPEDLASGFSARRGWLYAGAAFVAIFAILWFVHSRGSQNPGPTRSTDAAAAKKPAAAWPTNTLTPDAKAPTAGPATSAAEPAQPAAKVSQPVTKASRPAPPQTGARTIWRVVLYTYSHESDAQKRASEIAARKPDLHAEVFSSAASGPYLVVAGDGTTREEAARIRVRAIREGMPRDSYIQNYSH